MTTTVVAVFTAATLFAVLALVAARWAHTLSERRYGASLQRVDELMRIVCGSLEHVIGRANEARERGVDDLSLMLGLDELLEHVAAEAAERTNAEAVALRVEGPGETQSVTSFGPDDGAALLDLAPIPPGARPFRALTIGFAYGTALEERANVYRSAVVVPIVEGGVQTGALVACAANVDAFRPEHVHALEALLGRAAPAITSARRLAEAEHRTVTDPVTGVRNGTGFEVELERQIARARRSGRPLSLLVLRVDTTGDPRRASRAPSGDGALPEFAALLTRVARGTDIPCRPRDRELAIVLPDTKGTGARVASMHVFARKLGKPWVKARLWPSRPGSWSGVRTTRASRSPPAALPPSPTPPPTWSARRELLTRVLSARPTAGRSGRRPQVRDPGRARDRRGLGDACRSCSQRPVP
ncbi:MAG TPA: diguanylate cyclase [Gaiellaceae bacterium]|nr:diguanylate cyclase [Gaiellaceae bacterium]